MENISTRHLSYNIYFWYAKLNAGNNCVKKIAAAIKFCMNWEAIAQSEIKVPALYSNY